MSAPDPAPVVPAASSARRPNAIAIAWFLGFVVITLGITYWAARRTEDASEFFAAGGNVSAARTASRSPATS